MDRSLPLPIRRTAVVVMYGAFAAGLGCLALAGGWHPLPTALGIAAVFAVSLAAFGVLFTGTRYWRWGNAPDRQLDEFHVASRNRAYLSAYQVVSTLGMAGLIWLQLANDHGWHLPDGGMWSGIFWAYTLVVLTLPASILAWIERDLD